MRQRDASDESAERSIAVGPLPPTRYLRWERRLTDAYPRYYEVYLQQDLLDTWVLTRVNGGCGTPLGQVHHQALDNYGAGITAIHDIATVRKKHRYRVVRATVMLTQGVLAPNAKWRSDIVPEPPVQDEKSA